MFSFKKKIEVNLGSETDNELLARLHSCLEKFSANELSTKELLVGSQYILTKEFLVEKQKVIIISETYEGVTIKGPKKLILKMLKLILK